MQEPVSFPTDGDMGFPTVPSKSVQPLFCTRSDTANACRVLSVPQKLCCFFPCFLFLILLMLASSLGNGSGQMSPSQ